MKTKLILGKSVSVKLNDVIISVMFSSLVDLEQKIIIHSVSKAIIDSVWTPVNIGV
jgi:hypothetical protein